MAPTTQTPVTTLNQMRASHDRRFIHSAYRAIRGPAPDPEGLTHFLRELGAGASRIQILAELRSSSEGGSRITSEVGLDALRGQEILRPPSDTVPVGPPPDPVPDAVVKAKETIELEPLSPAVPNIESRPKPVESESRSLAAQRIYSKLRPVESESDSLAAESIYHEPKSLKFEHLPPRTRHIYLKLKAAATKPGKERA